MNFGAVWFDRDRSTAHGIYEPILSSIPERDMRGQTVCLTSFSATAPDSRAKVFG